ncbi:hypothetical protein HDU93_009316 [Gonapodya sp. JEL0774]|nr:hypothetical protein HDU93_009316 [Gonapodya sp. JEL0774]
MSELSGNGGGSSADTAGGSGLTPPERSSPSGSTLPPTPQSTSNASLHNLNTINFNSNVSTTPPGASTPPNASQLSSTQRSSRSAISQLSAAARHHRTLSSAQSQSPPSTLGTPPNRSPPQMEQQLPSTLTPVARVRSELPSQLPPVPASFSDFSNAAPAAEPSASSSRSVGVPQPRQPLLQSSISPVPLSTRPPQAPPPVPHPLSSISPSLPTTHRSFRPPLSTSAESQSALGPSNVPGVKDPDTIFSSSLPRGPGPDDHSAHLNRHTNGAGVSGARGQQNHDSSSAENGTRDVEEGGVKPVHAQRRISTASSGVAAWAQSYGRSIAFRLSAADPFPRHLSSSHRSSAASSAATGNLISAHGPLSHSPPSQIPYATTPSNGRYGGYGSTPSAASVAAASSRRTRRQVTATSTTGIGSGPSSFATSFAPPVSESNSASNSASVTTSSPAFPFRRPLAYLTDEIPSSSASPAALSRRTSNNALPPLGTSLAVYHDIARSYRSILTPHLSHALIDEHHGTPAPSVRRRSGWAFHQNREEYSEDDERAPLVDVAGKVEFGSPDGEYTYDEEGDGDGEVDQYGYYGGSGGDDFDPHGYGGGEAKSTFGQSVFNSSNVLMGIGSRILAKCMDYDPKMNTYADVGEAAFGVRGRIFISVLFILELLTACISLVILVADSLVALFPWMVLAWVKIATFVVVFPLTLGRGLGWLAGGSVVGVFAILNLMIIIVVDGLWKTDAPGSLWKPAETRKWMDVPLTFGLIMAGFSGHSVFPSIYRDMAEPSGYPAMVSASYAITSFFYLSIASVELTDLIDKITVNIAAILTYPTIVNKITIWLMIINPITKYPLNAAAVNLNFEVLILPRMADEGWPMWTISLARFLIRLSVSLVVLLVSIVYPGFHNVLAILGSFFSFTVMQRDSPNSIPRSSVSSESVHFPACILQSSPCDHPPLMAGRTPVPVAAAESVPSNGKQTPSSAQGLFSGLRTRSPAEMKRDLGWVPNLPILIMPGFMSSGLEVKESEVRPSWEGSRIWLSIEKLGLGIDFKEVFSSKQTATTAVASSAATPVPSASAPASRVPSASSLQSASATPSKGGANAMSVLRSIFTDIGDSFNLGDTFDDNEDDLDEFSEGTAVPGVHKRDDANERIMSRMWLRHVGLHPTCVEGPKSVANGGEGKIHVKVIEGLEGVDFLQPGALTAAATYVFAPVIRELKILGYTEKNLAGAPYDWRFLPNHCEQNDKYFTKTLASIEKLKRDNGGKKVVIIAHSMGNRMVHYFCNWVNSQPGLGSKWLEENVHSIYAAGIVLTHQFEFSMIVQSTDLLIGPPTLGSSKSVRSVVTGDSMGLPFLNREECIWFGRHLGSPPFLFPTPGWEILSPFFKDRKVVFTRVESYFNVTLHSLSFLKEAPAFLPKPGEKVLTKVLWRGRKDDHTRGTILRALKTGEDGSLAVWEETFQLPVAPPGKLDPKDSNTLTLEVRDEDIRGNLRGKLSLDLTKLILAVVGKPEALVRGKEVKFMDRRTVDVFLDAETIPALEYSRAHPGSKSFDGPVKVGTMVVSATFMPDDYDPKDPNVHVGWTRKKNVTVAYRGVDISEILRADGAVATANLQAMLENDPLYGKPAVNAPASAPKPSQEAGKSRTEDAMVCTQAPPGVKKIRLVYGTGRHTEVAFMLRRRTTRIDLGPHDVPWRLLKLDVDAQIPGFSCQKGVVFEDRGTPQNDPELGSLKKSGDGTVAYASLRHMINWREQGIDVTALEIPGAEHRGMLDNVSFLEDFVTYVGQKPAVETSVKLSAAEEVGRGVSKLMASAESAKEKAGKAFDSMTKDIFHRK